MNQSVSSAPHNNIFLERTRIAVAKAKLADDLEIEVNRLKQQLQDSHEREQHSREKLQLIVDQFKSQSEQVKTTAMKALSERQRLEKEAEELRAQTQKQSQQLQKMQKELDIALMIKKKGSSSPESAERDRKMNTASSFLSPFSTTTDTLSDDNEQHHSPSTGRKQRVTATTPTNKNNQNNNNTSRGSMLSSPSVLNSSSILLSSPPPSQQQHQQYNSSSSPASFAYNNSTITTTTMTPTTLLEAKRQERKLKRHLLTTTKNQNNISQQLQQHPKIEERLSSSAKLAARIAVALAPHSLHVEKLTPSGNVFRVGQLYRGWWQHSIITTTTIPTSSSSCSTIPVLPSEAMRKPPSGTCLDFNKNDNSSQSASSIESALYLSSFQFQHLHHHHDEVFNIDEQDVFSENKNNTATSSTTATRTTPFSALEFLATWVSLRPSQLCAISLLNRNELESVLDKSLSSSSSSILYFSNQFNRKEMFVVDCSRIGNERLCCCVFVTSTTTDNKKNLSSTTKKTNTLVASWLTLREIREVYAACVLVHLLPGIHHHHHQQNMNLQQQNKGVSMNNSNINKSLLPQSLLNHLSMTKTETTSAVRNNDDDLSGLNSSYVLQQLQAASSSSSSSFTQNRNNNQNFFSAFLKIQNENLENNLKNQTEIRFPCRLHDSSSPSSSSSSSSSSSNMCKDVYVTIRNINADCGLEVIESWISHFSVDFFLPDIPVHVMKMPSSSEQQENNNDSSQSYSRQTLLLRADLSSPGQIVWCFAKNDHSQQVDDDDDDESKIDEEMSNKKKEDIISSSTTSIKTPNSSPIRRKSTTTTTNSPSSPGRSTMKKPPTTASSSKENEKEESRKNKKKSSANLISIMLKFRCTDSKSVSQAAKIQQQQQRQKMTTPSSFAEAICSFHLPPPPPALIPIAPPSLPDDRRKVEDNNNNNNENHFSCVIPDLTTLTIHTSPSSKNEDNTHTSSSLSPCSTFQVNGETYPSSSGSLRIIASKTTEHENFNKNQNINSQFIIFPLSWRFVASIGNSITTATNQSMMAMSNIRRELLESSYLSPIAHRKQNQQNQQSQQFAFDTTAEEGRDYYQNYQNHQNHESSSSELVAMKERAYEVFGIGLAAADAWMTAASSWMTRFNVFKALLLFESCRATETQSLKQAAWIRRTLLTPPKRRMNHPQHQQQQHQNPPALQSLNQNQPSSSSPSQAAVAVAAAPTTRILFGNNNHENTNHETTIAPDAADRWAQYMLLIRFADWTSTASDTFAWSFDAVVSEFFSALTENRLAIGSTEEDAAKQLMSFSRNNNNHNNNEVSNYLSYSPVRNNNTSSIARRAIFTSPCAADGGDEFLMKEDWSDFSSWMEECTRSRLELLLHYGDAMSTFAAESFSQVSIEFQQHVNEMMATSKMDVFATRVADCIRHNRSNFGTNLEREEDEYERGVVEASMKMRMSALEKALKEERRKNRKLEQMNLHREREEKQIQQFNFQEEREQQKQQKQEQQEDTRISNEKKSAHDHHYHAQQQQSQSPPSSPSDLQIIALKDRSTALEMECETLAIRLDAAEKKNLSHVEKAAHFQQKLEQAQQEAKDYFAEMHRLREGIDKQVEVAVEVETRQLQKELKSEKNNCDFLKREIRARDEMIQELKKRLEKEQGERMNKYREMLKEFSSGTSLSPVPLYQSDHVQKENRDGDQKENQTTTTATTVTGGARRKSLGDVTNRQLEFPNASTSSSTTATTKREKSNSGNAIAEDSLERAHNELGKMIQRGPVNENGNNNRYQDPKEYFSVVTSPSMKFRSSSAEERDDLFQSERDEKRRDELMRKLQQFVPHQSRFDDDDKQQHSYKQQDKNTTSSTREDNTFSVVGRRSTSSSVAAMEDMSSVDVPTSFLMEQFASSPPPTQHQHQTSLASEEKRIIENDHDGVQKQQQQSSTTTRNNVYSRLYADRVQQQQQQQQKQKPSSRPNSPSTTTTTRSSHNNNNIATTASSLSSSATSTARPRKIPSVAARPKRF